MANFDFNARLVNRVLMGLLFIATGLTKLLVFKPAGVTAMLDGLGFPLASVFAWILILVETLGGLALLFSYQMKYVSYLLIVVMVVAAFTSHLGQWADMLKVLVLASNLWILSESK